MCKDEEDRSEQDEGGAPPQAPLVIDTRLFRPLPQALFRSICSNCDRAQAMWEMGPGGSSECVFVCSLCFLYESQWGQRRADQIPVLIADIEAEKGEGFLRAPDGRLLFCKDADGVVGAIALASSVCNVVDMASALRGPPTSNPSSGDGGGSRA